MHKIQPATTSSQDPICKLTSSLTNHSISFPARILLALLSKWSGSKGYAWWGVETMAGKLGRSVRSVQYYLRQLEQAGLLLTVPCPNHSNYYFPYPDQYTGPLAQFMDGNLAPRRRDYDAHAWTPPPVQEDLEIEEPQEPPPRDPPQEVAPIKENEEITRGTALAVGATGISDTLQPKETRQKNLFSTETENMLKGWQLLFSIPDPHPMLRVIAVCVNQPLEQITRLWTDLCKKRRGDYHRVIARDFCQWIADRFYHPRE